VPDPEQAGADNIVAPFLIHPLLRQKNPWYFSK